MALINCPECSKEISDSAPSCIYCGKPLSNIANRQIDRPNRVCPPTHLAKAIIVTFLCCWPFGIPAIVNASEVSTAFISGQYERAEEKSKKANKWANITIWVGVAFWSIYIAVCLIAGFASAMLENV